MHACVRACACLYLHVCTYSSVLIGVYLYVTYFMNERAYVFSVCVCMLVGARVRCLRVFSSMSTR